ncbi:MAG: preprotein translocase subunit SecG [Labrys sp. (in: a-proteobacteria)]
MQTVVIVIHLMVVLALVGVVLLQRSEGGGLGMGSGNPGGFMTGRGQANLLTRTTAILAGLFFLTSLLLSILAQRSATAPSVLDRVQQPGPTAPVDGGSTTPPAGGSGGVLEQLQGQPTAPAAPAAPAAPSTPVVPQSQ